MARTIAALILLLLASACRPPADTVRARDDGPRIVSLSPALSRMLVDLGLEDRIVGRSAYCEFLPDVPVVGDLLAIDYERLIDVAPTIVLVQAQATGVDPRLAELAVERGWSLRAWSGIDGLDDIEEVLRTLPGVLAAPGSERHRALTARVATLLNEMAAALSPAGAGDASWSGSTLLVYTLDPVGVFGRGTYLSEVLVRLGAGNATEATGWAELSLEDVVRLDPGAIILIRANPEGAVEDPRAALGPLAALPLRAVRAGRVAVLADPEALRPSTGVIRVARALRAILRDLATARTEAGS